jgi:hypothetical protein
LREKTGFLMTKATKSVKAVPAIAVPDLLVPE